MNRSFFTFYTLLLSQTFSLIGSQMTSLALGIWIYETTGDATPLTLVAFFAFLPRVLTVGFAGVFADKYDRRYVMALADAGQAIGTIILLSVFLLGIFQLWHLYLVAVIQAVFGVFQAPAFQASITMLIPDKHRDRANAIQMLTGPLAGIIAPSFAGALYAFVGLSGVITVDLVTFLVGVIVVLLVDIPKPDKSKAAAQAGLSFWSQAFAGLRYVWESRSLFYIFCLMGINNFFIAGMMVLRTPYVLSRTNHDEIALGLIMSVASAGSIGGTILMSIWGGFRPRIHNVLIGSTMMGLSLFLVGTQSNPIFIAVAACFGAIFPPIINASLISILQIKVPHDLQGRVFAAIQQMSMTLMPLSYLLVGQLADNVFEPQAQSAWAFSGLVGSGAGAGIGLMHLIAGAIVMIVALAFYAWPAVRHLEQILPDYVVGSEAA
jgi:DHA3 family macrolide efflux protein-like MFS transporter